MGSSLSFRTRLLLLAAAAALVATPLYAGQSASSAPAMSSAPGSPCARTVTTA
jgi:hypothetical protein